MGRFNRNSRDGAGKSDRKFGNDYHSRSPERAEMFPATCNDCGQRCEVPFRPTGERPVFCHDCFRKNGNAGPSKFGDRDSRRPSFEEKRMFSATCDKCGERCEVPFRPTGEKPVYRRACFGQGDSRPSPRNADQSQAQFEILNTKLDKILRALTPTKTVEIPKPMTTDDQLVIEAPPKKAAKKVAAKKKK